MKNNYALIEDITCGKIVEEDEYKIKIYPDDTWAKKNIRIIYLNIVEYFLLNILWDIESYLKKRILKKGINQR